MISLSESLLSEVSLQYAEAGYFTREGDFKAALTSIKAAEQVASIGLQQDLTPKVKQRLRDYQRASYHLHICMIERYAKDLFRTS